MTDFFIIKKFLRFMRNRYAPRGAKISFSASGEDLIVSDLLLSRGIKKPSYIDIGAHHPVFGNNTYLFYTHGGQGVIIEPNEKLCSLIQKKRRYDTCICAGAGQNDRTAKFYNFLRTTRSTFSEEQAREWEQTSGQKAVISTLPILSLDTIIARYAHTKNIGIVSIDAEGYDLEILYGFSFSIRPRIFCVESIKSENGHQIPERDQRLYEFFKQHDYFPYAETLANTIFVDILV